MLVIDRDEQPISRFVFLSVVFHALLFITYPQWSQMLEGDVPSLERGGTIQVLRVEQSPTRQISPVTNPASSTQAPTPVESRPQEAPQQPQQPAVAPQEQEPEEPVTPRPEPQPEPEPEVRPEQVEVAPDPEPQPDPQVSPATEPEPEPATADLLTSEQGPEVVVEDDRSAVQPDPEPQPEPLPRPTPEQQPSASDTPQDASAPSGSGQDADPGTDDAAMDTTDGSGEVEQAPPPPPPPPSGRSLVAGDGRAPVYPKSAEHDEVEGTVRLEISVTANADLIQVEVARSSGDQRLDNQAARYIEAMWQFQPAVQAYILTLDVEFSRIQEGETGLFDAQVHFGEVRWADE